MDKQKLHQIADHFGKEAQTLKACEELAEVIQALARGDVESMEEEIADVYVMLKQMEYLYNLSTERIEQIRRDKIERTLQRIEKLKSEKKYFCNECDEYFDHEIEFFNVYRPGDYADCDRYLCETCQHHLSLYGYSMSLIVRDEKPKPVQEEPTVKSHSEQDILNGCIMLMGRVYESMIEFMELHDFDFHKERDGTCDEKYPRLRMSATEIVNVLFLYKTRHSGGTSTLAKAREFDLKDGEEIIFTPHVDVEED